jgi:hypothetical protein
MILPSFLPSVNLTELTELSGIELNGLAALQIEVPIDGGLQRESFHVVNPELIALSPAGGQNIVLVNIEAVAANERPVNSLNGLLLPDVPEDDPLVPAARNDEVRVFLVVLDAIDSLVVRTGN